MIPEDLRHLERPGFQLLTSDEALMLICLIGFGVFAYEMLRSLVAWMFGA